MEFFTDIYWNVFLDYPNKTIENYIIECTQKLSSENINLIADIFLFTEYINYLIYWMNRLFGYLDRWYIRFKMKTSLSKIAMKIYESIFFEKVKNNIFKGIDRLINEERNGNIASGYKIKKIWDIFYYLNFEHPQIIKENNEIKWININDYNYIIESTVQDIWINDYFCEDTRKFVEAKAKNNLKYMSIT